MKSIIFVIVFCFFIGLGYIDHSRYGIVYNSLEELRSDSLENHEEKQLLSAPCSEFGGG
jgi:hypothetical protein